MIAKVRRSSAPSPATGARKAAASLILVSVREGPAAARAAPRQGPHRDSCRSWIGGGNAPANAEFAPAMRLSPLALLFPLAACSAAFALPKDPKDAVEHIRTSHVLHAGASQNRPWMRAEGGEPQGLEPDLVRAFAASLGARVEWTVNGEAPLMEALGKQRLDLVAAGGTAKSPWKKTVALTQAYAKDPEGKRRLLFAAAGENGLLLALDRFIVAHKPALQARAAAESRR